MTNLRSHHTKKGAKAFRQLKVKGAATTSATVRKLSSGKRYEVYVAAYKGDKLLWKCTGQVSPKVK
ncbi:MAG: fibronectin type III domain-containing protein [Coriobacteriales bacterium]